MAQPLTAVRYREFDDNGDPLAGGKVYTYLAGTTTPQATYSDSDGTTPNTNPVVLDADGAAVIYLADSSYKIVVKDSADVTLYTLDDVEPAAGIDVTSSSAVTTHTITDGQAATDLDGQTVDFSLYSAAVYEAEIIRGSPVTVHSTLRVSVQKFDGTGRVLVSASEAEEAHGVTFSLSVTSGVATLKAATSSGPGAGTIKLSRKLIPA